MWFKAINAWILQVRVWNKTDELCVTVLMFASDSFVHVLPQSIIKLVNDFRCDQIILHY